MKSIFSAYLFKFLIRFNFNSVPLDRSNPYSMDHAWTWLARLLNLPPQKITPFLLYIFLKVRNGLTRFYFYFILLMLNLLIIRLLVHKWYKYTKGKLENYFLLFIKF